MGNTARATLTGEPISALDSQHAQAPAFSRRILCKSLSNTYQNRTAPWGQIRTPFGAELEKPLFRGALLRPGQIGKWAGGVPWRLASLQLRNALGMRRNRSRHNRSVPEFKMEGKTMPTVYSKSSPIATKARKTTPKAQPQAGGNRPTKRASGESERTSCKSGQIVERDRSSASALIAPGRN